MYASYFFYALFYIWVIHYATSSLKKAFKQQEKFIYNYPEDAETKEIMNVGPTLILIC